VQRAQPAVPERVGIVLDVDGVDHGPEHGVGLGQRDHGRHLAVGIHVELARCDVLADVDHLGRLLDRDLGGRLVQARCDGNVEEPEDEDRERGQANAAPAPTHELEQAVEVNRLTFGFGLAEVLLGQGHTPEEGSRGIGSNPHASARSRSARLAAANPIPMEARFHFSHPPGFPA
jgi:hypothetical protein